jgi:putative FmdB family regulatory protein
MAKYEYNCIECDITTEVSRPMTEDEVIPPCPTCGYKMVRSWKFNGGIQFNGSGFYTTDKSR